jgi:ArsR family transcriptional regulator, arsenate/arsenite/antimonite-responsive transcriptional repressor
MAQQQLKELEGLFKTLGDTTRLRIIGLLLNGEVCVCHIHESLRMSQPKVSRHLAYLRAAGLVETRRAGLWIHYRLVELPDPLRKTLATAVHHTLSHIDVISKDAHRLQTITGCCLADPVELGGGMCCSLSAEATRSTPRSQNP